MLTAKGCGVRARVAAISSRRWAGEGWVRAVRMPRPPALETAAARGERPIHCMPPWMMGTRIWRAVVRRVVMGMVGGFSAEGGGWFEGVCCCLNGMEE